MKVLRVSLIICLFLSLFNCSKEKCKIDISGIDFSYGINYEQPNPYLIPGEQSNLKDSYLEEVRLAIGTPIDTIADILKVCQWVNQHFTFQNAGGSMIGENTVDELFAIKTFYGCHSKALIISSILREFGFPALMIETAMIKWAYDYNAGITNNFIGHVMTEVYVGGEWILLDNDGSYIKDYVPDNPYINTKNKQELGFFVFAKGIDIWEYTHKDDSFTHDEIKHFANNIYCYEELFYTVNYQWTN